MVEDISGNVVSGSLVLAQVIDDRRGRVRLEVIVVVAQSAPPARAEAIDAEVDVVAGGGCWRGPSGSMSLARLFAPPRTRWTARNASSPSRCLLLLGNGMIRSGPGLSPSLRSRCGPAARPSPGPSFSIVLRHGETFGDVVLVQYGGLGS